jgi:hypothetical protein
MLAGVGANGANAELTIRDVTENSLNGRTCIHTSDIFERREEKHEHDTQAEDLYASARHVQHECLHRERLGWRDGEIPSAFVLQ